MGAAPNIAPSPLALAAINYAERGWPVFPLASPGEHGRCSCSRSSDCSSPAKHPRTERGFLDASTDGATVATWWARWPNANIGLATSAGRFVLDLDGEEGRASLRELGREHGPLPPTLVVTTGAGAHAYFSAPEAAQVRGSAGQDRLRGRRPRRRRLRGAAAEPPYQRPGLRVAGC